MIVSYDVRSCRTSNVGVAFVGWDIENRIEVPSDDDVLGDHNEHHAHTCLRFLVAFNASRKEKGTRKHPV